MPAYWEIFARALGDRVDAELVPALYERVSVPTAQIREELRALSLPFQDVEAGQVHELNDLVESARKLVRSGAWKSAGLGALSGALGPLAMPPELAASMAHHLRLAQRLAVVFGFDPETDAGKVVVARAMAAAYDVALPDSARLDLRVRNLPALFSRERTDTGTWLAKQVVQRTAASLTQRVTRLVPGLSVGLGAWSAGRRTGRLAEKMIDVYGRALEAALFDVDGEELAVEVR